ncbi:GALACTINOL--SUCROSE GALACTOSYLTRANSFERASE 2-RELATED [Ceraceosorus bombacis]|uniref:GALACTINOL--SUCROSE GALACTOSYLTRANSFERASE 2-RELATED n=1 Tax=Ceraceosorus bombacis TaxID=401625 RepID=A0A0P1BPH4_9BASI|nr:GALACTINOL--SUCROSE GALACTOSYLTRANSFERASE 2-RELATED [Ceraceosorus bombacis]
MWAPITFDPPLGSTIKQASGPGNTYHVLAHNVPLQLLAPEGAERLEVWHDGGKGEWCATPFAPIETNTIEVARTTRPASVAAGQAALTFHFQDAELANSLQFTYRICKSDGRTEWLGTSDDNVKVVFCGRKKQLKPTFEQVFRTQLKVRTQSIADGESEAALHSLVRLSIPIESADDRMHLGQLHGVQQVLVIEHTQRTWHTSRLCHAHEVSQYQPAPLVVAKLTEHPDMLAVFIAVSTGGSNVGLLQSIQRESMQTLSLDVLVNSDSFDGSQSADAQGAIVYASLCDSTSLHFAIRLLLGHARETFEAKNSAEVRRRGPMTSDGQQIQAQRHCSVTSDTQDIDTSASDSGYISATSPELEFAKELVSPYTSHNDPHASHVTPESVPRSSSPVGLRQERSPPSYSASVSDLDDDAEIGAQQSPSWSEGGLMLCTWEALNHERPFLSSVLAALASLERRAPGACTSLLLDDGWADTIRDDKSAGRGLMSSMTLASELLDEESPEDPSPLASYISAVHASFPNVRDVGVWLTLVGYWNGLSVALAEMYGPPVCATLPGPDGPVPALLPALERLGDFWDDMLAGLVDAGVTFIKLDAQGELAGMRIQDEWLAGHEPAYNRAARAAFENAKQRWLPAPHTTSSVIHSMAMGKAQPTGPAALGEMSAGQWRTTDDIVPGHEAAARWLLVHASRNIMLFEGSMHVPDADMLCTSAHASVSSCEAKAQAAFRALYSGARLTISDPPLRASGELEEDALSPLLAPIKSSQGSTGPLRTLQAASHARLLHSNVFEDVTGDASGAALLMVQPNALTNKGDSTSFSTIGGWNTRGPNARAVGHLSVSDVAYALKSHPSQISKFTDVLVVCNDDAESFTLVSAQELTRASCGMVKHLSRPVLAYNLAPGCCTSWRVVPLALLDEQTFVCTTGLANKYLGLGAVCTSYAAPQESSPGPPEKSKSSANLRESSTSDVGDLTDLPWSAVFAALAVMTLNTLVGLLSAHILLAPVALTLDLATMGMRQRATYSGVPAPLSRAYIQTSSRHSTSFALRLPYIGMLGALKISFPPRSRAGTDASPKPRLRPDKDEVLHFDVEVSRAGELDFVVVSTATGPLLEAEAHKRYTMQIDGLDVDANFLKIRPVRKISPQGCYIYSELDTHARSAIKVSVDMLAFLGSRKNGQGHESDSRRQPSSSPATWLVTLKLG